MKFVLLFIALCLSLASCKSYTNLRPNTDIPVSEKPIHIMSYNIRIGAGYTDFGRSPYKLKDEITLDLKSVIAGLRSSDPDILALQEVLGEIQAEQIGKALNMNYAYIPHGNDRYGAWWGVALLSKYPILSVSRDQISWGKGNARALLVADLDIHGKTITVISIHKDRDTTDGNAFRETMKVINKIKTPVVLAGDLNMWPDDERHKILEPRFEDSVLMINNGNAKFARERGTYPGIEGDNWGKRIDYILLDEGMFLVKDTGLMDKKFWDASDHIAIYTKVLLKH